MKYRIVRAKELKLRIMTRWGFGSNQSLKLATFMDPCCCPVEFCTKGGDPALILDIQKQLQVAEIQARRLAMFLDECCCDFNPCPVFNN